MIRTLNSGKFIILSWLLVIIIIWLVLLLFWILTLLLLVDMLFSGCIQQWCFEFFLFIDVFLFDFTLFNEMTVLSRLYKFALVTFKPTIRWGQVNSNMMKFIVIIELNRVGYILKVTQLIILNIIVTWFRFGYESVLSDAVVCWRLTLLGFVVLLISQ